MAFILRRCLSTAARRLQQQGQQKFIMAIPAPTAHTAALETAELQELARKAQGSWKELSNEEAVKLYRSTFPYTYKEMASEGDYKIVTPAVLLLMGVSIGLYLFVRKNFGPAVPHTFNNPEWEAATRAKLIKDKANPIEGISSRV